jgi:membrane protein YdbS with pleckstrin-like domain
MPYWVKIKTGVKGPYSRAQLDGLQNSGKISDRALIAQAEDGPWQRLAAMTLDEVAAHPAPLMDYEDTSAKIHMTGLWSQLSDQMQSDDPAKAIEVIDQLEQCDLTVDEREDLASMRASLLTKAEPVVETAEIAPQEETEVPSLDFTSGESSPEDGLESDLDNDSKAGTTTQIPQELLELLNDHEEMLFRSRPESLVLYINLAITGLLGTVLSIAVALQTGLLGFLLFLGFAFVGYCKYLRWKNTVFVITASRIFSRTGVFNRSITLLPTKNVQAVNINTGTIDRWLGLNKVVFLTGASLPVRYLGMNGTVCFHHVDCKAVMKAFESEQSLNSPESSANASVVP